MPDRQTAEESTHTSSSSFTYRKKGGTSPPHPTPKESGSGTGNVTPEDTGPRQLPQADSLYKQTLIQRRFSHLSLGLQHSTQTKHAALPLRLNISLRKRERRAHGRTHWRAVTKLNTNGAELAAMESPTQTQGFPDPSRHWKQTVQAVSVLADRLKDWPALRNAE